MKLQVFQTITIIMVLLLPRMKGWYGHWIVFSFFFRALWTPKRSKYHFYTFLHGSCTILFGRGGRGRGGGSELPWSLQYYYFTVLPYYHFDCSNLCGQLFKFKSILIVAVCVFAFFLWFWRVLVLFGVNVFAIHVRACVLSLAPLAGLFGLFGCWNHRSHASGFPHPITTTIQ